MAWNVEIISKDNSKLEINFKNGQFEIINNSRDLSVKEINDLWSVVNIFNQTDYKKVECIKT